MSDEKTKKRYKINPDTEDNSIRTLLDRIKLGYELQEIENEELTDEEILKFSSSIILAPDYQREYRFTFEDEVKLVESVLLGIPIPPIFLATDKYKKVRVANVVDGQHRLRALYRFKENVFKLKGLELLDDITNKIFRDLDLDIKNDFLDFTIQTITFKDFPGNDFELEIFSRYNKGTKPLSPQEIRHAVYNSDYNVFINDFTYRLYKDEEPKSLYNAYNITKNRIQKKKIQGELFVILSILENGINKSYNKSLDYAENYMKEKSEYQDKNKDTYKDNLDNVKEIFTEFNKFINRLEEKVDYPFSKEIYGVSSRNYKFQISTAMILSGIFNKIHNEDIYTKIFDYDKIRDEFLTYPGDKLRNSFLEDPEYKASSTDSKKIYELIEEIYININTIK